MISIGKHHNLLIILLSFSTTILVFGAFSPVDAQTDITDMINASASLLEQGNTKEAIPILEKVLENDPENLTALRNLSVAYYRTNMCSEAIELYDKILVLKPNYPEILYGKAVCLNNLGLPESSLVTLEQIDEKFSNENAVLLTKASSYVLLREFNNAEEYYLKILEKKPDHKSATAGMLNLSYHLKEHEKAEKYLVKILGDEPKRTDICGASGCMGNTPFLFPVIDSDKFEINAQVQIRNESDQLIAIIETEKITYTPHPIFDKILSHYDVLEVIQNDNTNYEVRKITQKNIPIINDYFMDRIEFWYNDYTVLFGYNLAIPLENGDYIVTEWTIKKKI